jgi:hypothetical protein
MSILFIAGGQQRAERSQVTGLHDWCEYHKALLLAVDTRTGICHRAFEYTSPTDSKSHRQEVLFKTGSVDEDTLYLCTQTEVLIYRLPNLERIGRISLPCFNDLHHVRPAPGGRLLVANTGLDMVLLLEPDGTVVHAWNVLGADPWSRFSPDLDYRAVDTKPHAAHPNHVFFVGEDIWATRFHQRDAVCLTRADRRIALDVGLPHDGVLHEGRLYFTTVNGYVLIADAVSLRIEETIDLNAIHGPDVQLGWCRGVFIRDGQIWIGFSRLRSTKFRENVKWVVQGFRTVLPTRIARYDLVTRQCVSEINLELHGLNAVYGIFPASPSAAGHVVGAAFDAPRTVHESLAQTSPALSFSSLR